MITAILILLVVIAISIRIGYQTGVDRERDRLKARLSRHVPHDIEHMLEHALADSVFLSTLRHLYKHDDVDINGGDLVEAIGFWAEDKPWLAIADIEAMLPCMKEGRS